MIGLDELPLWYYPAYRKALRDLREALQKSSDHIKRCGMNNTKGICAIIGLVLNDPKKLMYSQSLTGYEVPEPYLSKFRAWKKKQKESRQ